ncbi:hypothetical protein AVEN_258838-1 [Araneus ventricosus]|uniref:Uncharacterized protein n=1 Tax=Araneus ventricosus TaxID=182803 RepID=A0A4Y2KN73_ARAVE|nr:hypothetical protein AVEN_258838-1 [Araneus ventricosus]
MFVLVFFYEEKKYSVLKLKEAVKNSDLQMMNLHTWDTKKSVETKWRDGVYPANFLQFGGEKQVHLKIYERPLALFQCSKIRCPPEQTSPFYLTPAVSSVMSNSITELKRSDHRIQPALLTSIRGRFRSLSVKVNTVTNSGSSSDLETVSPNKTNKDPIVLESHEFKFSQK